MTPKAVDLSALADAVDLVPVPLCKGRVTAVRETVVEAEIPSARIGMRVALERPGRPSVPAEVVHCDGLKVKLLPLAHVENVGPGDRVVGTAESESIMCGSGLVGRIVNALGEPLDGRPPLADVRPWPLHRPAPDPLRRRPIDAQLLTGIRQIDGCLALGLGQKIGLFAGPGVGKTTLLGTLARRAACDLSVVCLVGERGREVKDLLDRSLGAKGLARSVVVLATADSPAIVRVKALETATAIAERFRADGLDVLLLVDSLTRAVRASRDVALALGEQPARKGFPPSAFAALPSLLERTGRDANGSITAVYAVLTEGGEDDPVAEEARSLLDGHIALSSKFAQAGRWPAIDLLRSVSRVMDAVVPDEQARAARLLRSLLSAYEEHEDLIMMGAYKRGSSRNTDIALDRRSEIERFLLQNAEDSSQIDDTRRDLAALVRGL